MTASIISIIVAGFLASKCKGRYSPLIFGLLIFLLIVPVSYVVAGTIAFLQQMQADQIFTDISYIIGGFIGETNLLVRGQPCNYSLAIPGSLALSSLVVGTFILLAVKPTEHNVHKNKR
jgi:hypothetical protein